MCSTPRLLFSLRFSFREQFCNWNLCRWQTRGISGQEVGVIFLNVTRQKKKLIKKKDWFFCTKSWILPASRQNEIYFFKTVGNRFCRCCLYWVYLTFSLGKEVNIVVPQGIFLLLLLLLRFVLTNSISRMWNVPDKSRQNSDKAILSFGKWAVATLKASSCCFVKRKIIFCYDLLHWDSFYFTYMWRKKTCIYKYDKLYRAWYYCRCKFGKYQSLVRSWEDIEK